MTVEVVDGVKVIKLRDSALDRPAPQEAQDMLTMAYLWQLLSGGHGLKDGSIFERRVL